MPQAPLRKFYAWQLSSLMEDGPVLSDLANTWVKLKARERKVLVKVAERLLMGQKAYGELVKDKKKWRAEAAEEHLDATVYMACELIDALEDK